MSRLLFFRKLLIFVLPLGLLFALPLFVLWRSAELLPVSSIARRQRLARDPDAVFGPAYTNPDKGFKMAALVDRDVPIAALGTSRVMQLRASMFRGGETAFYNAGGVVTRIGDYRRVLARLARDTRRTRSLIVGIDHWMFNAGWGELSDDPAVERDYDGDYGALDGIQRALHIYPDLLSGKVHLSDFTRATEDLGVNGMSHGNGFRRDGSYRYADLLRDPTSGEDYQFRDTLARIAGGTRRFEPAAEPFAPSLAELDRLIRQAHDQGFRMVLFLPPYAPLIWNRIASDPRYGYLRALAPAIAARAEAAGVPFVDFSACGHFACRDDQFVDGFHGGEAVYAHILGELASRAPWLAAAVDESRLRPATR